MKKIFILLASMLMFSFLSANEFYDISFQKIDKEGMQVTMNLNSFDLKNFVDNGITYQTPYIGVSTVTNEKGWAELPFVSTSLALYNDNGYNLNYVYDDYVDIQLDYPLLPSRGTIYRNQNPSDIPYVIDNQSIKNEFYPLNSIISEDFMYREQRGLTLRFFPFQYNSATNTLRYYKSIRVEVVYNNSTWNNPFSGKKLARINEIQGIFRDLFINYEASRANASLTVAEYGDMLILTPSTYVTTIQPYVDWKREMGYNVTVQTVATGTNVTSTIQTAYTANPNLLYVQLVGDWADIKSPTISSTTGADPCDAFMGAVSGSDNYIDISVGRFSCSNATHLTTQINKAIEYEKNPNMESGWRETFIGVASNEGSGSGDDGEVDYLHVQRIYTGRMQPKLGYTTHKENYAPSANVNTLATSINAGASTIAYCGHGAETYWVTTGYSNTNVNASSNGDKLPFIVSVACVNGTFHYSSDCFAEAWLKKQNGGAVVTWMATINQPWTPPQRGQDYFYDVLAGGYNYDTDGIAQTTGYNTTEQRTHWGAIVTNAAVLMIKESSTSSDIETMKTWTTFGDASLQLRTETPKTLALSNNDILYGQTYEGVATIGGSPAKNVMICLSQNGTYCKALTDESGNYALDIEALEVGTAKLVATGFNGTTIYEDVEILSPAPCDSVQNLVAVANLTSVELTWDAPEMTNVTGYRVYRDNVLVATLGAAITTFSDNITINGLHEYYVKGLFDGVPCVYRQYATVFINDGSNSDCAPARNLYVEDGNATWQVPDIPIVYFDDIESHNTWAVNSAGETSLTFFDGDQLPSKGISGFHFPNDVEPMSFMVVRSDSILKDNIDFAFNTYSYGFDAYSGDKFLASFSANGGQNDDWLISRALTFEEDFFFKFQARSGHQANVNESFRVVYSTTTNDVAAFTNVVAEVTDLMAGGPNVKAWATFSYTIPAEAKYVAIHHNALNKNYLCIDDIYIGDGSTPTVPLMGYNVYCDDVYIGTSENISFLNENEADGYHNYKVEAVYADGCISPAVTFNTMVTEILPVQDNKVVIFPNPVQSTLNVQISALPNTQQSIDVYDISGRLQFSTTLHNIAQLGTKTIDVSWLKSGIYFVKVGNYTAKFIKE